MKTYATIIAVCLSLYVITSDAGELDNWAAEVALGTPMLDDPSHISGVEWRQGDPIFTLDVRRYINDNMYVGFRHMSRVDKYDRGPNFIGIGYRWGR